MKRKIYTILLKGECYMRNIKNVVGLVALLFASLFVTIQANPAKGKNGQPKKRWQKRTSQHIYKSHNENNKNRPQGTVIIEDGTENLEDTPDAQIIADTEIIGALDAQENP